MKRQMTQGIRSSVKVLAVWVLAVSASPCSATLGPVDSVATDNPAGSPPYNILSITVGNYTVNHGGSALNLSGAIVRHVAGTNTLRIVLPSNIDLDVSQSVQVLVDNVKDPDRACGSIRDISRTPT